MAQELKVKINNSDTIEERIKKLGATFLESYSFIDTYSKQPFGEVLKVSESNNKYAIIGFKEIDGKFQEVINKPLSQDEFLHKKAELIEKYGLKRILQGKRKIYRLDKFRITFNIIEDVGEFLILTGENPTEKFITDDLKINDPQYIRVSFDELPIKKKG